MQIFDFFKKKGIDTLDTAFYFEIGVWESWYQGNVRSFHSYRVYQGQGNYTTCRRKGLQMAKKLCEDMADLLLNERVKITIAGTTTDAFVKSVLEQNNFLVLGNEYQERKAAAGTVAYVPYLDGMEVDANGFVHGGVIKINYVTARNIFPLSWENGVVTECAFLTLKTHNRKDYAHIQLHRKDEQGLYVIENLVVECTTGSGRELLPEEWGEIPAFARLTPRVDTGSAERQFVIDRLNIVNNADIDDTNPMGVSLFANSIGVLQSIDLKYDSYANEFSMGRKRLFVSPEALSNANGEPVFDPNDTVFCVLPEDYFSRDGGKSELIKESNMTLRVEEHSQAINDDLNYLSIKCGFGTQRYRFEQGNVQTATQVISENSDLYRTIQKHEIILDSVIKELIRIIIRLGVVSGVSGLDELADVTIDFDDSIIEDKASERSQDRQDVAMGVMSLAEYRAKWYAETEEVARGKLPEQTGVME